MNKATAAKTCGMLVLALDPSSTRTGFAVLDRLRLVDAGYLAQPRRLDALARSAGMVDEILGLLRARAGLWRAVLIEVPSGRPRSGLRANAGGYLAIYGLAVGAIWQAVRSWCSLQCAPPRVCAVTEREWTRGVPKRVRQRRMALLHPQYAAQLAKDSGGDVADAIGLGAWWLANASNSAGCGS